ncbi:MAG: DNA polymerase I [Deltaproteobacteria bacterium]|nr:MAG: DNA polymerase I [Deltaproteobacteria bacterium]
MASAASKLPAPGADDVLFIVDLSGYVFRAYHALPELTNSHGEPTGATLGTINMLSRLVESRRPAYLAVAMDSPGKGFRGEIDPAYKANRPPAPEDLIRQLKRCHEVFETWGMPVFSQPDYEADDLIATLTTKAVAAGLKVVIASSDKDLYQLVQADQVLCWDAMRNRVFGPAEVEAKLGVRPELVHDYLSLVGDSSDNIPGVRGVGPKTATKLLTEFESLDGIFENLEKVARPKLRESLREQQEAARQAHRLVALRHDADVELDLDGLRYDRPDVAGLRKLFTELEFSRLLDRLDEWAPPTAAEPPQPRAEPAPVPPEQPSAPASAASALTDGTLATGTLTTTAQLAALCDRARDAGHLVVVAMGPEGKSMRVPLTGIALASSPQDTAYLPIGHRYLPAPTQLSLAVVREILGPVLADETIAKLGHDLKVSQVVLSCHDLPVRGARYDTMLASYLLDPESPHTLGTIAQRDGGMEWTTFDQIAPRPKRGPKPTIEEVDIEQATPYARAHAEAVLAVREQQRQTLERYELESLLCDLEMPVLDVLTEMEQTGVLVNPAPLAALAKTMTVELAGLAEKAHTAAGRDFNLASPKQLEAVLFDELGLKSTRKTKTGRSTNAEALEAIVHDHPLPALVLEHRATAKLLGTYVDALPKLIHPDTGRIHTRWEQAVTATGRISSKDPNLQNIPIRSAHGKRIREAFCAPEGAVILSADYSQIELRVLAHLSHDPKLVEAFNTGQDVHARTAMEIFGVAADEVTPTMRSQSKTVNFGVIYGMGSVALAKRLGITRKEAKSFIEAYFDRYRGVQEFMDRCLAQAKDEKSVRTLLGRRRLLPDLESSHHGKRAYAERIAQNTPIQGSAADLLKLAMVKLADPIVPGARMVMTVHDELVFEVPADQIEVAVQRAKTAMESIIELDVPLVVDIGWGPHWAAAH